MTLDWKREPNLTAGSVRVAAQSFGVTAATLELFNLFSKRPDWVLDARLDGAIPRLWLAGTGEPQPYTQPRQIDVAYIDAPTHLTIDGREGKLVPFVSSLVAVELAAGRARIDGSFVVRWTAVGDERDIEIAVDVIAALVT